MSIDVVLQPLDAYKLRKAGPDRWRAICPSCGGANASSLSIGATPDGTVLLKCFSHGCQVDDICAALGIDMQALVPQVVVPGGGSPALVRRRLLSPAQALELLNDEAQLVVLCALNIAHGVVLTADDRARCQTAGVRIAFLRDEAFS